jgi:hypothetical protein
LNGLNYETREKSSPGNSRFCSTNNAQKDLTTLITIMTLPARHIYVFFCLLAPLVWIPAPSCSAESFRVRDTSFQRTFELFRDVPCLTADELEFGREVIAGLSYNSMRVFRKMCEMEDIDFARSKQAWATLIELDLSYEQTLTFEKWSDLEGATAELALTALPAIKSLNYEPSRSFRSYCSLPEISPENALSIVPLLTRFDDTQHGAIQAFLGIPGINAGQALDGLKTIAKLRGHKARAAGAFAGIPGMRIEVMADALPLLSLLHQDDAWNAKTLFASDSMTPEEGWFWLTGFFANPPEVQEQQFFKLSPDRKETLLRALYDGGEELIWKINNLHAVTDRFGIEISNRVLQSYSTRQIQERFEALSPQVRSRFGDSFYSTPKKNSRITLLKKATAAERVETARRLTSANVYALLSQGSELYDSSFRNILVPILIKRINQAFSGNLLVFLKATDADNQFVSNYIVSLAQKGKLTTFFPDNVREQEQILDLVAKSAFKDEDSIILFSATFMHLLEVLKPSARTFLINRMGRQADSGTAAYSRLITVILQYYLEEFPQLLGAADRITITRLVVKHGAVDLQRYLTTPFAQWKADGMLSSISIFHPDDDGLDSFRSNGRMLLKSGYRMDLSETFTVSSLTEKRKKEILQVIRQAQAKPTRGLPRLFASMRRNSYAVSFTRRINGVSINHATFVYSGELNQELLMERFILSGTEMFAQRGHSYWRSEQMTDPLTSLLKKKRITAKDLEAKQRFLSLGSCGGVKAYTRLTRMFLGKVDILATIGTGLAVINDPYNKNFFEIVAKNPSSISWKDMARELAFIFKGGHGRDYLQPGSLPAILHKILDEEKKLQAKVKPGDRDRLSGSRENELKVLNQQGNP